MIFSKCAFFSLSKNLWNFKAFSDATITFPTYRFAQLVKNVSDVYYMNFTFHGSYSAFKCNATIDKELCDGKVKTDETLLKLLPKLIKLKKNAGPFLEIKNLNIVEHCDDLQYLFTSSSVPRITDEFSDEGQIVSKYTKLLYSFAKNG